MTLSQKYSKPTIKANNLTVELCVTSDFSLLALVCLYSLLSLGSEVYKLDTIPQVSKQQQVNTSGV